MIEIILKEILKSFKNFISQKSFENKMNSNNWLYITSYKNYDVFKSANSNKIKKIKHY